MIDRKTLAIILMQTLEVMPRFAPKLTESSIDIWYQAFGKYDEALFRKTMRDLILTTPEFPTMNVFKDAIENIESPDLIAAKLWTALMSPPSRKKLDDVCQETIRLCGGWEAFRETTIPEMASVLKSWRGVAAEVNKKKVTVGLKLQPVLEKPKENKSLEEALKIIRDGARKTDNGTSLVPY